MREHPIPQDVTGYRFHLVGDMTLKQFAELLVGVILALIFYKTNLPGLFRWPLTLGAAGLGFAMAFVPFEERPLDQWLFTFVKSLYKPTKFYWRRQTKIPDPFKYEATKQQEEQQAQVDLTPAKHQKIKEFMQSIDQPLRKKDEWDRQFDQRVGAILNTFSQVETPELKINLSATNNNQATTAQGEKGEKDESGENIGQNNMGTAVKNDVKSAVSVSEKHKAKPKLKVRVRDLAEANQVQDSQVHVSTQARVKAQQAQAQQAQTQSKQTLGKEKRGVQQTRQVAQNNSQQTTPQPQARQKSQENLPTKQTRQPTNEQAANRQQVKQAQQTTPQVNQASFNSNLPLPSPPTQPNSLTGMVITPQEELVAGALVEVRNSAGQVVRAVKTNSLGQFFITTPLSNDNYFIQVKKPGYNFAPQQLQLSGQIVKPIEIRAQTT
jgi:hypothetical protein